eukprot:4658861-Amphidinium_carterae.1
MTEVSKRIAIARECCGGKLLLGQDLLISCCASGTRAMFAIPTCIAVCHSDLRVTMGVLQGHRSAGSTSHRSHAVCGNYMRACNLFHCSRPKPCDVRRTKTKNTHHMQQYNSDNEGALPKQAVYFMTFVLARQMCKQKKARFKLYVAQKKDTGAESVSMALYCNAWNRRCCSLCIVRRWEPMNTDGTPNAAWLWYAHRA